MPTESPAAPHPSWFARVRRGCLNIAIVALLTLMVVQGMPLNMNATNYSARWCADWMGCGHLGWGMFAPEPDRTNHRISAEIMDSDDHVLATWTMPNWQKHSSFDRFRLHRWNEYYDNVWTNNNSRCWPKLAEHIVRTTKLPPGLEAPPKQVRLIAETKFLTDPRGKPGDPPPARWPKPAPPEGYDDRWVLSIEQLP
jgi:hypothetical protein